MPKFEGANWEALKEIGRWLVFFVGSWLVTELLNQINLVPETYPLKVWVFSFVVPVRFGLQMGLTMLGRYLDKYKFVESKERIEDSKAKVKEEPKGLLPF